MKPFSLSEIDLVSRLLDKLTPFKQSSSKAVRVSSIQFENQTKREMFLAELRQKPKEKEITHHLEDR